MKLAMNPMKSFQGWLRLAAATAVILGLSACSKEEDAEQAEATVEIEAPAETETAQVEESTTDTLPGAAEGVAQVDVRATMNTADAALKQNDLEKATDALLKLQLSGALKNNQSAAVDHYQRMIELQKRIADGAMSGDPKAQRAAALLRQSAGAP